MEDLLKELLGPIWSCLQGGTQCENPWTHLTSFFAMALSFVFAVVLFTAVLDLLKDNSKLPAFLITIFALLALIIVLPDSLAFVMSSAALITVILSARYLARQLLRYLHWTKVRAQFAIFALAPALYLVFATAHLITSSGVTRTPAILLIADPEAQIITDNDQQQILATVTQIRVKVIDSFDQRDFNLIPDDPLPYLKKAWPEITNMLNIVQLSKKFDIQLAVTDAVVGDGSRLEADLHTFDPQTGDVLPVPNGFITVDGSKEKLGPMLDLLSYRIAKRIVAIRQGHGLSVTKDVQIVDRFLSGLRKSLSVSQANSLLTDCKEFRCADTIAASLASWLEPTSDREGTDADKNKLNTAVERLSKDIGGPK